LYVRRRELIEGKTEPTEDEIEKGQKAEEEDEELEKDDDESEPEPIEHLPEPTAEEFASAPKGIPEFWLTTLKNHVGMSDMITERDEEALKHLVDISVTYPDDKPGFTLIFEFGPGAKAFFEQTTLTKTYYYQEEIGYEGDFVYDHAVGSDIKWKEGKDLTVKIETKKQRNKNTNQTRIVKKVVPTDSFFTFFKPPTPTEDEDENDDIDERLELDYQIGEDLKERVVPRAVDFFTGKALRFENDDDEFDTDDEFDEEEDEDDDDDDDDDEPSGRRRGGARKAPAPPLGATPASAQDPQECKQQ